jgi:hypothetical protein
MLAITAHNESGFCQYPNQTRLRGDGLSAVCAPQYQNEIEGVPQSVQTHTISKSFGCCFDMALPQTSTIFNEYRRLLKEKALNKIRSSLSNSYSV